MQIREVFDRKRFVFLDGGMGTQLQTRGLQPGQKPELAALASYGPRGGTAVDVGGWLGPWTARLARRADRVVAVVEALHPDPGYVSHWRQALRVIAGET